jgi:hypothetical protein
MSATVMPVYTVYYNPSDFPGQYVVRRFFIEGGNREPQADRTPLYVGDSLERAQHDPARHVLLLRRRRGRRRSHRELDVMDAGQGGAIATCAVIAGLSSGALIARTEARLVWPLTLIAVAAVIGLVVLALA